LTVELDKIADMTQGDLRRFIVNLLASDPGAIPRQPVPDVAQPGMVPLADIRLTALATQIDFPAIPGTFAHLMVVANLRSNQAVDTSGVLMRFNDDSSALYQYQLLEAVGATPSSSAANSQTSAAIGVAPGNTAGATNFSTTEILISNYASDKWKTFKSHSGANAVQNYIRLSSGVWVNTSPITKVSIISIGSFNIGSRATLYGLNGLL